MKSLGDLWVPLPPLTEQDGILARIETGSKELSRLERTLAVQVELLREYRQALISATVTGQLDLATEATEIDFGIPSEAQST